MNYGIAVYKQGQMANLQEVKEVLEKNNVNVLDTDKIQIFVNAIDVTRAVEVLNVAGYETDEDELE